MVVRSPLKRTNGEMNRRTRGAGIVPNRSAAPPLVGDILMEQQDKRAVGRRCLAAQAMATPNGWRVRERPAGC